jgi:hypothetical protein
LCLVGEMKVQKLFVGWYSPFRWRRDSRGCQWIVVTEELSVHCSEIRTKDGEC